MTWEWPGLSLFLGAAPGGGERTLLISFLPEYRLELSPRSGPGCARSRTGADPSPHLRAVNGAL